MGETSQSVYDDWERTIWRAWHDYKADLCPGCGQPMTRALFDAARDEQPRFMAGFMECLGCRALAYQQDQQRIKDVKAHKAMVPKDADPALYPSIFTSHRHWVVQPADEQPIAASD